MADPTFPPLPINIPGNQGTVLFADGTYPSWVQPAQQIVPLATKTSGVAQPPFVSPPLAFQLVTGG